MSSKGPAKDLITGVLLAGGRSSRMFPASDVPADKGLMDLAGGPMIRWVSRQIEPQVRRLVINANGDPARFAQFSLPVVADTISGYMGPLAGLLAGMRWSIANAPEMAYIVTAPVDTPFIPRDFVPKLSAAIGWHKIALAASRGRTHPVIGLWSVSLADDLEVAIKSGNRAMMAWVGRHDTIEVAFPDMDIGPDSVDPFFNVNTPEDLEYAYKICEYSAQHW